MILEINNDPEISYFVKKLYLVVDDEAIDDIICWDHIGSSFMIKD